MKDKIEKACMFSLISNVLKLIDGVLVSVFGIVYGIILYNGIENNIIPLNNKFFSVFGAAIGYIFVVALFAAGAVGIISLILSIICFIFYYNGKNATELPKIKKYLKADALIKIISQGIYMAICSVMAVGVFFILSYDLYMLLVLAVLVLSIIELTYVQQIEDN